MTSPFLKLLAAGLPIFMLIVFFIEGIPSLVSGADYAIVIGYLLSIVAIIYWVWIAFRNKNIKGR